MDWKNAVQFLVDVKICLFNTTSTLALRTFRFLQICTEGNILKSNVVIVELTTEPHQIPSYKMHGHQHRTFSVSCLSIRKILSLFSAYGIIVL
jgi:hypothetical protein